MLLNRNDGDTYAGLFFPDSLEEVLLILNNYGNMGLER